jgi:LPXTG-motif cell wall-anchored protein
MNGKSVRIAGLMLAVMMVLVLAVVPAYAASSAQASMPAWNTLAPGQTVEWDFAYTGNANGSAMVLLGMNPANSVGFNVYTDSQWRALSDPTQTVNPIGKGTQTMFSHHDGTVDILYNGDLTWGTDQVPGETFHIQVYSTSQQPAQYSFTQSGAGAGGLVPFVQMAMTQPPAAAQPIAVAQATGTKASPVQQGPLTLPVTGGSELIWLFGAAGVALLAAGWLARRRTN